MRVDGPKELEWLVYGLTWTTISYLVNFRRRRRRKLNLVYILVVYCRRCSGGDSAVLLHLYSAPPPHSTARLPVQHFSLH